MGKKQLKALIDKIGVKQLPILSNADDATCKLSLIKDEWLEFTATGTIIDNDYVDVVVKLHNYVISTFRSKGYSIKTNRSDSFLSIKLSDHSLIEAAISSFDMSIINKVKNDIIKNCNTFSSIQNLIHLGLGYTNVRLFFQESGWILYDIYSKSGLVRRAGCIKDDTSPIKNSVISVQKEVKERNLRIKAIKIEKIKDPIIKLAASELIKHNIRFKIEDDLGPGSHTLRIYCDDGYGRQFFSNRGVYCFNELRFKYNLGDPEHNVVKSLINACRVVKKLKKIVDSDWVR